MLTTQEKSTIMQADVDGKKIEYRSKWYSAEHWREINDPAWDWSSYEYRVKKEKKTLYGFIKPLPQDKEKEWNYPAYGANVWFESEQELRSHYNHIDPTYQIVSVEIEV